MIVIDIMLRILCEFVSIEPVHYMGFRPRFSLLSSIVRSNLLIENTLVISRDVFMDNVYMPCDVRPVPIVLIVTRFCTCVMWSFSK